MAEDNTGRNLLIIGVAALTGVYIWSEYQKKAEPPPDGYEPPPDGDYEPPPLGEKDVEITYSREGGSLGINSKGREIIYPRDVATATFSWMNTRDKSGTIYIRLDIRRSGILKTWNEGAWTPSIAYPHQRASTVVRNTIPGDWGRGMLIDARVCIKDVGCYPVQDDYYTIPERDLVLHHVTSYFNDQYIDLFELSQYQNLQFPVQAGSILNFNVVWHNYSNSHVNPRYKVQVKEDGGDWKEPTFTSNPYDDCQLLYGGSPGAGGANRVRNAIASNWVGKLISIRVQQEGVGTVFELQNLFRT